MTECEQLIGMNVRSVEMMGPNGAMVPSLSGQQQLNDIWAYSCAQMNPAWPDQAAMDAEIIALANGASMDSGVAEVFQTAVEANDASNTNAFRPILQAMGICIQTWWFNIYIWRRV